MKTQYRIYIAVICIIILTGLTGCLRDQKKEPEGEKTSEESLELYYLNADEDGLKRVSYTLENADDPLMASYEVTYKLSDNETIHTSRYKASISEGVVVNSISIEDGEETVDFGAGYRQLKPVQEILCRTSVVKSLVQIDGVDSVRFTINGDSLLGSDDIPVGSMDDKTFILDDEKSQLYDDAKQVTLYYANEKGTKLVACEKTVKTQDNVPMETSVLYALLEEPEKKGCQAPLPSGLKINQTQIQNNVCYVDLSSEIENVVIGVEEKVTVYAMVNTITSLGKVSQVQFTVNGKKVANLNDFDSFHLLMTCDYSLVKNNK